MHQIRYIGDALAILNIIAFLGEGVQTQQLYVPLLSPSEIKFMDVLNKQLFTVARFTSLSNHGSVFLHYFDSACVQRPWLLPSPLAPVQVMLQGRLYALYQRSRIILPLMIFGYVSEIAAMSTILGFVDYSRSTFAFPLNNSRSCIRGLPVSEILVPNEIMTGLYICSVDLPSFFRLYIFWLPVLVYDTGLCLLALWYGISVWMSGYRARRMDGAYIADVLLKGSAGYFLWTRHLAPSAFL
ncbi:hypothetical protein J3R83DRAFT_3210 [Lanmaoa asiatica]|nr:hypothetical protein J3R83DRAFT_3210 [Lanmaoa asiatica]